jgi:hypothetical protein
MMASQILDMLETAEGAWRAESPEWKQKMGRWRAWQACQKTRERASQKAAARKRNLDDETPQQGEEQSWESYFDPDYPSPQFSFAGTSAYPKEELQEDIASLDWTSTPKFLFKALWRGIAVHHSGMYKGYRILVERYAPSLILSDNQRFKEPHTVLDFIVLGSFGSLSQQVSNRAVEGVPKR